MLCACRQHAHLDQRFRRLTAGFALQRGQRTEQTKLRLAGRLVALFLTSLLNGSNQSLTSSSMNNAAGITEYCAKQKLASVTDTQNVKTVLDKLGLSAPEQKQDTNYMDGIQGLLNAKDGQQLDLNTIGNSSLAKQVKPRPAIWC